VGRSRSRRTRRRIPRYSYRDIHTALIHQCIHPRVPTCQTKLRLSDWQVLPRLQDHQSNWNLAFRSAAPFDRRRKARKRPAEMTIAIPSLGFCSERPEPMLCPGGGGTSPRSFLAHLGSPPNQVPEVTALPRRDAFPSVSVALFDVLVRVASQAFIDRYREARADHLAGREAILPAGTWWLHRFAGVKCAELGATAPPSRPTAAPGLFRGASPGTASAFDAQT